MNKKKTLLIGALAVIVLLLLIVLAPKLTKEKEPFAIMENMIDRNMYYINAREASCWSYMQYNTMEAEYDYMEYFAQLVKTNEEYYKQNYSERYAWELAALEKKYGKDFELSYEIISKQELSNEVVDEIQDHFSSTGKNIKSDPNGNINQIDACLNFYGAASEEIDECINKYTKYTEAYEQINVSSAYKMSIEFTIDGEKEEVLTKDIYMAEIDEKYIIIRYVPANMDHEEPEWYGFGNDITPEYFYDELFSYSERLVIGENQLRQAGSIFHSIWEQSDGSGRQIMFTYEEDEEYENIGFYVFRYVDSQGNTVSGYENPLYFYEYLDFNSIALFDKDNYIKNWGEDSCQMEKNIGFIMSNYAKLVLEMDGKLEEFLYKGFRE